jgi:hypothetical protein
MITIQAKSTYKYFTVLFLFFVVSKNIAAQQRLTLKQQQEDFTIFKTSMQEMHAGVYWFITPERFNKLYDSVYATLKENEDAEQFYLKVRYCMAALKHGHNGVNYKGEPGIAYRLNSLHKSKSYLPFSLQFLGKRLYIINNCSGNKAIPNGSEILSINGKPVKQITNVLKQYIFANGNNETYRYAQLGEYYQFHYLYQMLYGNPSFYKIEIIPFNKKKRSIVKVDAVLPQTIADEYKKQNGKDINDWGKLIEYKLLDGKQKTGYLKLETFSSYRLQQGGEKMNDVIDSMFVRIKNDGIRNLIVDIRNNEGGDDWMTTTSYFKEIPSDKGAGLPYFQSDKYTYIEHIVETDDNKQLLQLFKNNPAAMLDKMPDGRFKLKPEYTEGDTRGIELQKNAFKGKVFLLQNGLTFSAGFAFAGKLNYLMDKDGSYLKVIGEENADDEQAGVGSGGWGVDLLLPNSKLVLNVPVTGGGDKPYAKKLPTVLDYKVIPTISDKIKGIDIEVEFAKKLIADKKMQ